MNSKEITLNNKNLKLTEKEINTILYIFEKKNLLILKIYNQRMEISVRTRDTYC